ncbi:MAG TPA: dihydroorotate dehydrogenase [Coriobacteriia bacterium]|jgi:dihydroorotate dehydrogenase (NAD+) catalytic subunit
MSPNPGSGTEPDLSVNLGRLELRNPVMTAAGTFASGREYAGLVDIPRLGALVTKGVSLEPWPGNPSPRIAETASGMLNSIGLQNPGLDAFIEHDLTWLSEQDVPVIVNVHGHSAEEFARICERLEDVSCVSGFELNVSCPNVDEGGMAFGTSCEAVAAVTAAARRATRKLLMVKLSPNVTDIAKIARAAEAAGADAVSLVNTLLGMAIDADTFRPKLGRVLGGLSGPAIKPIALRMVWQVSAAVSVPVVGMGGIMTAEDAVEFMLAGASAVAVGTATFVDPAAATHIIDGLAEFCRRRGVERVSQLTGALEA